jgi:hypothetical protein
LEQLRQEQLRLERERLERERLEQERLEQERLERLRREQERSPTEEEIIARLTRVSGSGNISGVFPPNGYELIPGQLENRSSVDFTWSGGGGEHRFALYRTTGAAVIPPSSVTDRRFTLSNPQILTEGKYIWQIFEKDGQGEWQELPSAAQMFTVTGTDAGRSLRVLPSRSPGELYGNR